jgi:hypothetical protein
MIFLIKHLYLCTLAKRNLTLFPRLKIFHQFFLILKIPLRKSKKTFETFGKHTFKSSKNG